MTQLTEVERLQIWRGLMRYWSTLNDETPFLNTDLKNAVDVTDSWIDSNQTNYSASLPNPFKTNATPAQKTILFCIVAAMRVSPQFARALIGEVD